MSYAEALKRYLRAVDRQDALEAHSRAHPSLLAQARQDVARCSRVLAQIEAEQNRIAFNARERAR
jgi:hypothetical protein